MLKLKKEFVEKILKTVQSEKVYWDLNGGTYSATINNNKFELNTYFFPFRLFMYYLGKKFFIGEVTDSSNWYIPPHYNDNPMEMPVFEKEKIINLIDALSMNGDVDEDEDWHSITSIKAKFTMDKNDVYPLLYILLNNNIIQKRWNGSLFRDEYFFSFDNKDKLDALLNK